MSALAKNAIICVLCVLAMTCGAGAKKRVFESECPKCGKMLQANPHPSMTSIDGDKIKVEYTLMFMCLDCHVPFSSSFTEYLKKPSAREVIKSKSSKPPRAIMPPKETKSLKSPKES